MPARLFSYEDCWKYACALSLQKNTEVEKIKNNVIALCKVTPEYFWSNFSCKLISFSSYSRICRNLDKHISKDYPIPYLTNKVFFFGLSFFIKKGTFIPQKDTEILVEKTLNLANKIWKKNEKKMKVLDIGTGCGNVVISLAKNKPNWSFIAVDNNKRALKIAKKNSVIQQVKNIEFTLSSLFESLDVNKKFDIIVSNPPYVSIHEYKDTSLAVKKQPKKALISGDGYSFYQKIFSKVKFFLNKKFLLIMEIGYQQKEKLIKLTIECFPHANILIFTDYETYPRVLTIYQL